jgi:hypothetical protein
MWLGRSLSPIISALSMSAFRTGVLIIKLFSDDSAIGKKKTYLEIEVMVKNKPYLLTTLFKNLESKAMPQV